MTSHLNRHLDHTTREVVRQSEGDLREGSIEQRADILGKYVNALITAIKEINCNDRDCFAWAQLQVREDSHSGVAIGSEVEEITSEE